MEKCDEVKAKAFEIYIKNSLTKDDKRGIDYILEHSYEEYCGRYETSYSKEEYHIFQQAIKEVVNNGN